MLGMLHIDMVIDQAAPEELIELREGMAVRNCRIQGEDSASSLEGGRGAND